MAPTATAERRYGALPANLPPIGLRREAAAAYVSMSATKFDELVVDGRMPKPKHVDGCVIWPVEALKKAFDALPGDDSAEGWYDGA